MHEKELTSLETQLALAETLERKYSAFSCLCCSPAIAQTFTRIAEKHRSHAIMLRAVIQEGKHRAEHE